MIFSKGSLIRGTVVMAAALAALVVMPILKVIVGSLIITLLLRNNETVTELGGQDGES